MFFDLWQSFRCFTHLNKIHLPNRLTAGELVLGITVPGFAFFKGRRKIWGIVAMSLYALAGLVFITALGYQAGSLAYAVMVSLHATSIIFVEGHWLADTRLQLRLVLALCTLFVVWVLLYSPVAGFAERHFFMPLRVGNRVLVINPATSLRSIKQGDWVAYRINAGNRTETEFRQIVLHGGLGFEPVLALPGNEVAFSNDSFLVNGTPFPLRARMPHEGGVTVPENVWFIWPSFHIIGGGMLAGQISQAMQKTALVSGDQIIGRPFKHWFFRRQTP